MKTRLGRSFPAVNSPHSDAMLSVDGKIFTKACYVSLNNWADEVFDVDYKIMPLHEIEKFYK